MQSAYCGFLNVFQETGPSCRPPKVFAHECKRSWPVKLTCSAKGYSTERRSRIFSFLGILKVLVNTYDLSIGVQRLFNNFKTRLRKCGCAPRQLTDMFSVMPGQSAALLDPIRSSDSTFLLTSLKLPFSPSRGESHWSGWLFDKRDFEECSHMFSIHKLLVHCPTV